MELLKPELGSFFLRGHKGETRIKWRFTPKDEHLCTYKIPLRGEACLKCSATVNDHSLFTQANRLKHIAPTYSI